MMNTSSPSLHCCRASSKELYLSHPGNSVVPRLSTTLRLLGSAPLGNDSNVRRPMIMVWPVVSALKRLRSLGNQYSSLLLWPMARLRATAAMMLMLFVMYVLLLMLYAHFRAYVVPRVVSFQTEVFIFEVEQALNVLVQNHSRQLSRCTCELQTGLIQMVKIQMCVAGGMYEVAGFQSCHLCHHHEQQRV